MGTEGTTTTVEWLIRSQADLDQAHTLIDQFTTPAIMTLRKPKASSELTARLHCAIRCVAEQCQWAGGFMTEAEWKLLFVAGLYGQRVVPSPDGRSFVVLQNLTRDMSGPEKHDLCEYVYQFGAVRGVEFDDA